VIRVSRRPVATTVRRRAVVAGSVVVGAVLLAGCSVTSPAQTQRRYVPADGVPASVGPVEARDLVVVAAKKGAPGVLSGALTNTGDQPVTVGFLTREEAESASGSPAAGATVELKAREQKQLTQVVLKQVPVIPGAMTGVVLVTDRGRTLVNVPVLPPQGYYATVTPTAVPSPTTTATG